MDYGDTKTAVSDFAKDFVDWYSTKIDVDELLHTFKEQCTKFMDSNVPPKMTTSCFNQS